MHDGALGEAGLFNLQAIHQHLIHESTDTELKKLIEETKHKVNKLWAGAHLKKFIQWGKDSSGKESNHALNGPALKAVLRHATLLKVTIELMKPIYATLEASKVIKWDANGLPVQPEKPPKKQKGGKKVQNKPPPKKPARAVSFHDVGDSESDASDAEGSPSSPLLPTKATLATSAGTSRQFCGIFRQ